MFKGKNMPICSIIIPVYNIGKFIHQCLDSLLKQTYNDFEVIVIDDGSTDKSPIICDEYAKLDSRIKVFHKKNKGVSSALNMGLKHIQGKIVCFIDGDDWVEPNFLETIHSFFSNNIDVDILGFNYFFEKENDSKKSQPLTEGLFESNQKDHLVMATIIPKFIERKYNYVLPGIRSKCVKAFRKDVIEKNSILFNENIPIGEDAQFCSEALSYAKKYAQYNYYLYHYRVYSQSSNRKYRNQWDYVFERVKRIQDVPTITRNNDFPNVMATFVFIVIKRIILTFLLHRDNKTSINKKIQFLKEFTSNPNFPQISISTALIRYIPEYIPFLFLIKYKMFRTLLLAGKIFFK